MTLFDAYKYLTQKLKLDIVNSQSVLLHIHSKGLRVMRKWFSVLCIGMLMQISNTVYGMYHHPEGSFDVSVGWRKDSLHWIVGSPEGFVPATTSEVRWRDVYIGQILAQAKYVNCYNFYFRGYADYGRIHHGRQRDSDFIDDFEFSRSHSKVKKGEVWDLSGGIGYMFRFLCQRATITPIVGYSYHVQHFRMKDLVVTIDEIDNFVGPVSGLRSHFNSKFKGWWGGADITLYMTCDWWLMVSGEFHWGRYRGTGHWNLRTDFLRDFRQHSDCFGQVWTVGTNWDFAKNWYLTFFGRYQAWHQVKHGVDHVFLASGDVRSRLKAVKWHSMCYSAGVGYYF